MFKDNFMGEAIETVFLPTDAIYDIQAPINSVALLPKYQKIIKRISTVTDITTLKDIVEIDVDNFSKLPYFGNLFMYQLAQLQNAIFHITKYSRPKIEEKLSKVKLSQEQLETPLNQLNLSLKSQKLIKRISGIMSNVRTVQEVININPIDFSILPTIGKSYVKDLIELQHELPIILEERTKNQYSFSHYSIEFNQIDAALIEDVENYLWTLDEKRMDIALSRWGFNHQYETLEEVGSRHGVTRERIRQLEKPINTGLILNLRIQSKILWANLREKMTEDLGLLLPNLSKCFSTEKLFYEFIELCCEVENGSVHKIVFTKINTNIIGQLFCRYPSPIEQDIVVNELISNYGYSKASAINGIKQLAKLDKIKITKQGVYPNNLGRKEAIAHVLTFHPAGLPWKDIARIVNKNGYCSSLFDEARQNAAYSNEFIYLSNHGIYRNVIFLNLEQFDISKIMQYLIDYFEKNNLRSLHLHDYFYQIKGKCPEIEYFTLRHLVREYGERYNLYFNGKSGADTVSLDPEITLISQSDVIIKVLNESKVAMTKQEIAERLKSKSINHAAFYLSNLIEEGKVVRVDHMVYTTHEKAFKNIDTEAVMGIIKALMDNSNKIIEADVFREYVNLELNLSYSKYIYMALVRTKITELNWYHNRTLFSTQKIQYENLSDLCNKTCDIRLTDSENSEIIQKVAWLTNAVANMAIQQWKIRMK